MCDFQGFVAVILCGDSGWRCFLLLSIVLKGNTATEANYITWSNHHDLKGSKYSGLHFLFVSLIKMYICICFSFLIVSTSQMRPHWHTSQTLQTFPEKKGLLFPNPLDWLRKDFGLERRKCSFVKGDHNILDIEMPKLWGMSSLSSVSSSVSSSELSLRKLSMV